MIATGRAARAGFGEAPAPAPPRAWTDPPVLLALAAILLGVATLAWLAAAPPPGNNGAEAGFARDMSVHHTQAVEMAEIVRARTTDPDVRLLAVDIVLTQQAQIGQMRGWLDVWGLPATGRAAPMTWMGAPVDGLMPGMATPGEVARLWALPPAEVDGQFLQLMITHHRGGVAMAEGVVARTRRPAVLRLARAIVASQRAEMTVMEELLQRKGLPIPAASAGHAGMAMGDGGDAVAGVAASLPAVARQTVSLLPLPLALFAATWLGLDTFRRGRRGPAREHLPDVGELPYRGLAVGGLLASAALHSGLAPTRLLEGTAYGVFFAAAGAALAVAAAAILARPGRLTYGAGAILAGVLLVVWAVSRLASSPAVAEPEACTFIMRAGEVAAAAGCLAALRQPAREGAPVA